MGKIRKNTLVSAYALLAVAFLLGAMLIANMECKYIDSVKMGVAHKYTDNVEAFNDAKVWDKDGNEYRLTEEDGEKIRRLDFFAYIFPHMAYILSTLLASVVYYRVKLRKPLRILSNAATRIAGNDLDFVIHYERNDEFGKLCAAFEKMRFSLEESNKDMWRQIDERKRLNASFSHDMRTPLTVLEGNIDILMKYESSGQLSKEDISEIYSVMDLQLQRLHRYVASMNQLQSLEDIPISVKTVQVEELVRALKNTAGIICSAKELIFVNEIKAKTVNVDTEIVLQVFENIVSNAMRYANSTIEVRCKKRGQKLVITVSDDGQGFDPDTIGIATDPFYTTEKKSEVQHFGLGLNISKVLCQRHNGDIELQNLKTGGACVSVSFGA